VLDPEDPDHEDKMPKNTRAASAMGKASSSSPGQYFYMPARPNPGQTWQSQSLISSPSSLLTLPGVIPPTLVPKAIEVPQF
jgi:hypothetical protein